MESHIDKIAAAPAPTDSSCLTLHPCVESVMPSGSPQVKMPNPDTKAANPCPQIEPLPDGIEVRVLLLVAILIVGIVMVNSMARDYTAKLSAAAHGKVVTSAPAGK